jgi:GT2 family glycosyltransferase
MSRRLFIIIPVLNHWDQTRTCLQRLTSGSDIDFTVIVVDHGSTDGTRAGLCDEFPDVVRIAGNTDMWWTAATNLGIREALQRNATDVMLLNNDCFVEHDTIECLKRHQATAGEAVVAPIQRSLETGEIITRRMTTCFLLGFPTLVLPGRSLYRPQDHRLFRTPLIIGGRGVLIPTSVLDKTGLLNEAELPHYGSDHDFFLRCRKLRIPLLIASDAVVDIDATSTTLASQYGRMPFKRFLATLRERRSHRNLPELTALFRLHYPIPGLYPLGVALNLARYMAIYGVARLLNGHVQK